jgi:site-specific DNA-methyltransferase (adenine-specific)
MPDRCVDLVLTDPPYNIGVNIQKNKVNQVAAWDRIDNYIDWCIEWLTECQRVLKPNGVLYFWHNDMAQIAELMEAIRCRTSLVFVSFCIWDKGNGYRAQSWHRRSAESKTALRSWFNTCEYCLHFFNAPKDAEASWKHTGLDRINSNRECYKPLKEWYAAEMERLGITGKEIAQKYTEVTGKKPFMLRHYFQDSQFEIPTQAVYESVYVPLGFGKSYEELRKSYEELRKSYEELRKSYEELRNVHHVDDMHCNIWHVPPIPTQKRYHTCQKPTEILERLIRVSSNDGGVVLDCFMGSGSTGVAAINTGRKFIGIEMDDGYYAAAEERIFSAKDNGGQLTIC